MSLAVKLSSQCVRKHKWEYDGHLYRMNKKS